MSTTKSTDAGILPHRAHRLRRVAALDALDVSVAIGHAHAGAGLDQDAFAARVDEQQVQAAQDAAAGVGLDEPAPQRLRDDAEEAAGVGTEPAGAQHLDADPTGESLRLVERVERLGHGRVTRPRSKSAW